jgi:hypothetical protein
MATGIGTRDRFRRALLTVTTFAAVGCGTTAVLKHQGQYGAMPLGAFADSLGIPESPKAERETGSRKVKVMPSSPDSLEELAEYFHQWCVAHRGNISGDGATYLALYHATTEHVMRTHDSIRATRVCVEKGDTPLGAYLTFPAEGREHVAFYEPAELRAFIGKYDALAKERQAKYEEETAVLREKRAVADKIEAEAAARAKAKTDAEEQRLEGEEDAIVRASGVGGASIAETLAIMNRTRTGDMRGLLARIEYVRPCQLAVKPVDRAAENFRLKSVRVNVRETQESIITNPLTQESGTLIEHVVDVSEGSRVASITFASAHNAQTVAHGIQHLAALCGAR